jgi:hypothetical protein
MMLLFFFPNLTLIYHGIKLKIEARSRLHFFHTRYLFIRQIEEESEKKHLDPQYIYFILLMLFLNKIKT